MEKSENHTMVIWQIRGHSKHALRVGRMNPLSSYLRRGTAWTGLGKHKLSLRFVKHGLSPRFIESV